MIRKSPLSFALMALAMFIVGVSVMFNAGSAHAAAVHKVWKATVRVRKPTVIGNTTLGPGQYRVKITPASDGSGDSTIQFSVVYNPYGDEGDPPYEEEVVVTVKASTRDLGAPAASTGLILASGDSRMAASLEIRGNSAEYVFGAMTTSAENNQ